MKFEVLMLRGLFLACFAVCGLIFGAMLTATPPSVRLVGGNSIGTVLLVAPNSCALPADGVICPRVPG
ncbi:hypothetical protein ACPPVV_01835 [Rhodanobacter sp. Col0626]|uniref:hypothetical protein n=1 Tax=Rhodanobacter sp. Col0626 TaxID=3415679 RepID=UPI003CE7F9C0